MSKILILGAKGNLGIQLVKVFGENHEIFAWDREDIDVTDKEMVTQKILEIKPEGIINATGYNAVDKCENDENEYALAKKLNSDAVGYLSDVSLQISATLVSFASDYVFSGDKKAGYSESDETCPLSKYAQTKVSGEKEIAKRGEQGLKYYLIRTSKLFGPKGESEGSKESFFDLILRLSREQKEFKMIDGEEISCFTYTVDLARAIKKLIEENYPSGIYHLVNSGPASWYDGAKFLFDLKNITDVNLIPSKSSDYPRPAKRPMFSVLLNTKFEQMRDWKEALREYLK